MSQDDPKTNEDAVEEASQEEESTQELTEKVEEVSEESNESAESLEEENQDKDESSESIPEDPQEAVADEERTEETVTQEEPKIPHFRAGDTVRLNYKIIEGAKERLQPFEGIVISKKGSGVSKTFTVRRIGADRVGVERIFPLYSPNLVDLTVVKKGKVRRAKLYYLRDKIGKAATKIKERK